jgi:SAM-dependent methyltransferase
MKEAEIRPQKLFNEYLALAEKDVARFFGDQSVFVEVPCPACNSEAFTSGLEKLGFRYVVCSDCGSLYQSPRPTTDMVNTYYRESAAVKFWGTRFFRETAEARRAKLFRPRAQLVDQWSERVGLTGSRSFADVGSGYGIFLEEVARLGRFEKVIGIEPAPNLAAVCRERGFDIVEKPVEEVEDLQVSFATAFEVLEHVYDPVAFLESVRRILAPGGLLLFTTLTVSGFDIQVLWEHSKSVHPPHHINLISVNGMRRVVERSGFELLDLRTPGKLDVDIVHNIVTEDPTIPLDRFSRMIVLESDEEVREAFQRFLQENQLSSHICVVARVPEKAGS